jgi:hypothetical protein
MSSVPVTRVYGSCRDSHALNSDELQILFPCALDFQTQFNGFANALGDFVEGPPLRMASWNLRNRGYVIAFGIALNNDIELAWHRGVSSPSIADGFALCPVTACRRTPERWPGESAFIRTDPTTKCCALSSARLRLLASLLHF